METEKFNNYLENLSERERKENILLSLLAALGFTDAAVKDLVLMDEDTVEILYEGGVSKKVDICTHSGMEIIQDVMRHIQHDGGGANASSRSDSTEAV